MRAHDLGDARRVHAAQVVQRAHRMRRAHLDLAVDVQLVDVVDHLEQVDAFDARARPRWLDRAAPCRRPGCRRRGRCARARPRRCGCRRGSRPALPIARREAAEDARAVGVAAAEGAEQRVGHAELRAGGARAREHRESRRRRPSAPGSRAQRRRAEPSCGRRCDARSRGERSRQSLRPRVVAGTDICASLLRGRCSWRPSGAVLACSRCARARRLAARVALSARLFERAAAARAAIAVACCCAHRARRQLRDRGRRRSLARMSVVGRSVAAPSAAAVMVIARRSSSSSW